MSFHYTVALASIALLLASCAQREEDNALVIGMELSYPPFEMSDESNHPTGISVDLASALGKYLERPIRIKNISFQGLIPALKTKKIDLVISSMTATEERAQSIAFSDSYLDTGLCLLVSKNSSIQHIQDADQPEYVIATKQGTTGHLYAANHIRNARTLTFEKESSAVLEVVQGKVDAFIYDQMSTYRNWKRHPSTTRPILKPFKKESWAIGLRQDDETLRRQVNAFLKAFRKRGGFEELGERYLAEEKKAFQKRGDPFFF